MLPIGTFWPILVLDITLEIVPVGLFCDLQAVAYRTMLNSVILIPGLLSHSAMILGPA